MVFVAARFESISKRGRERGVFVACANQGRQISRRDGRALGFRLRPPAARTVQIEGRTAAGGEPSGPGPYCVSPENGRQWIAHPSQFRSGSTCHRRSQQWVRAGVSRDVFETVVGYYDQLVGIDWDLASFHSAMVDAPKRGDLPRRYETNRRLQRPQGVELRC